ncbi:MAG: Asp-tRNA(Asn)/Glu-tRNA(Gln) amidotransferase subunit GatA [Candidatus Niyogibacteria bacterium]|nr:MAG: Asp-tRNA(Asn)/Glu-tRNA(Gln) amidotransferase subunit GatA [Candidatus Niyogibacteria bacterium]
MYLTVSKVKNLLHKGEISSRELVTIYSEEIKSKNKNLNAYLETFNDVFDEAEKIDEHLKRGEEPRALEGIPFAIKDNILIQGKICSAASRMLENYRASYDAFVIKKLRKAGAIFLGRTNMDEFAMGSSTENSAFGATKNPYDETRVPGGSSGGSAAAVSANMALAALGSDTGGSIRQPAGFCGVVGLKPTYGAVSRSGLIAMASSLDQIGPITKTVEDAELIFDIIKGKDPKDSTSVESNIQHPPTSSRVLDKFGTTSNIQKLKIGIPKEFYSGGIDKDVLEIVNRAAETFRGLGHEVKEVSLPHAPYALAVYYIVVPAEVSANMSRFDGLRYGLHKSGKNLLSEYMETRSAGFGPETRRRIILGTYVLSAGYYDAYYARASKVRALIKKDFEKVFGDVDVLLAPASPNPAFKIGEKINNPLSMYLEDIFLVPANLAGLPAMSLPFGSATRDGVKLPVGIQLIAPWFEEKTLFEAGRLLEAHK